MMRLIASKKYFFGIALFIFSILFFTSTILAKDRPGLLNEASDGGKLRSCEVKKESIEKRAEQLLERATKMMAKFDSHATRVQTYYTEKLLPDGKVVLNYDTLVTSIAAKKLAVSTALTKAQSDADNFTCGDDKPRDQMSQFRKDMQKVILALNEYKTSIKNLIVAVRSSLK